MNLDIRLQNLRLKRVNLFPAGTPIVRGGEPKNPHIWKKCRKIAHRFLCYYWKSGAKILYIGCISADYKSHSPNLLGRIANYFQNHSSGTNKRIFDEVNLLLGSNRVEFGIFTYDRCEVGGRQFDFETTSEDADLIYMIENLLIGFYKSRGHCQWNR